MKEYIGIVSNDPMDYVKVALALETLAYHNKNYLDSVMCCDAKRSVETQYLLKTAIEKAEETIATKWNRRAGEEDKHKLVER